MKFMLFYLPSVGTNPQIKKGMIGQNTQAYQNMLWQLTAQVKAADEMGFWGVACTEHHFHIEGFEVSNNPNMLALYLGMQTKHIRVGQLANVLPFHNPLRLAEDIAMLDQMMRGRSFTGIARGYQRRWADTMGQVYGVGGTMSDKSDRDMRNRALFEDHYAIMKKAWAGGTFTHKSDQWTIPPDNLEFDHSAIRDYGRGLGADGLIKEIGTAPQCYQKPHPQIFQPFSFSQSTFDFCARESIVPIAIATDDPALDDLLTTYQETAAKAGRTLKKGDGVGIFRDCLVGRDGNEMRRYAREANGFVWTNWFEPIGFNEAFRKKGQTGEMKGGIDALFESGFEFVGTPDEVNRQIEHMAKFQNPEYFVMWQYTGMIPHDVQMRSLEIWANEILPNWV
ncbi:MAG: LLM class flavin-dependent oxidoreductase [Alphaproteobacteria bacterium]